MAGVNPFCHSVGKCPPLGTAALKLQPLLLPLRAMLPKVLTPGIHTVPELQEENTVKEETNPAEETDYSIDNESDDANLQSSETFVRSNDAHSLEVGDYVVVRLATKRSTKLVCWHD